MSSTDMQFAETEDDFQFLDAPRHRVIERLLAYWNAKCGDHEMPSRVDILPSEIVALLPHIILCDVQNQGADYRVRIFGTALVELVGEERTGKLVSEFGTDCNPPTQTGQVRHRWMSGMQATYATRRPVLFKGRMSSSNRPYIVWHGISCPLTNNTQGVQTDIRQIIGAVIAER